MAKSSKRPKASQFPWEQIEGAMGGSNDVTSGGGGGAGIPDPDMVMRTGDVANRGDVEEDKKKLFPERFGDRKTGKAKAGGKATGKAGARPGQADRSLKGKVASAGRSLAKKAKKAVGRVTAKRKSK